MAWLRVIRGRMRGATYLLNDGVRTAGREPGNRIHLDDDRASRTHARFEWAISHHRIVDLDSKNGTTVNGKPLRGGVPLADQDRIKIGSHLLIYELRGRPGYRDEGMASAGWLKVVEGPKIGATYHLGDRTGTIGRDPGNLIQLVDDDTSRRHAQIKWEGEGYVLVDLDSTNGTKVNGLPRAEHRLRNGDRVEIGTHVLVFEARGSVRYRDESLVGRNVAPHLTSEQTNVVYANIDVLGSIEIDVEIVEDPAGDESFTVDLEASDSDALASAAAPKPAPAPTSRPTPAAIVSPERRLARARERIDAQVRTSTAIPEFLERMISESTGFCEPDRLLFLFFSGASLNPRALRIKGQPGATQLPPDLLQAAVRHVVRHKRAVRKNDLLTNYQGDPSEAYRAVGTVVCAPILTTHMDYGVVYADNLGLGAAAFGSLELDFYRELGEQLARGLTHRMQRPRRH